MSRQGLLNTLADHMRASLVTRCTLNNNASAWRNASVTFTLARGVVWWRPARRGVAVARGAVWWRPVT